MKRFSSALATVILVLVALPIYSQNTTSTPIPDEDEVVKISTALVQIDVTVTDKNGKIVTDLKPEDLEIYANGKKQDITNFSLVSTTTDSKQQSAIAPTNGDINITGTRLKGQRLIALVIDDLGLTAENLNFTKISIKKFIDEKMQPGDVVALTSTRRGIGTTLRFTSDKRLLYAALEDISWKGNGREEINPSLNPGGNPIMRDPAGSVRSNGDNIGLVGGALQSLSMPGDENKVEALRQTRLTILTLDSLMSVINGMRSIPGRKSIMFFSDGLTYLNRNSSGEASNLLVLGRFQRVIDSAARASVVVNSVDAKGLIINSVSARGLDAASESFRSKTDGLRILADETGGLAFYNGNDLAAGVEQTLRQQSEYYLIGYQPDEDTFNTKYNKIQVKAKRPNLKVQYKTGFYGVSDESKSTQSSAQNTLMALHSPFTASDIELKLSTFFGNDKNAGSYVRSLLHIDSKNLKFTADNSGNHKANLDVFVISYAKDGQVIDQAQNNFTFSIKDSLLEKKMADGFIYEFLTPLKKPGVYEMRLVVRDTASSKLGSAYQIVEIPDLGKNKPVLSSIVLGDMNQSNEPITQSISLENIDSKAKQTNTMVFRRFKKGSVLSYGAELYNAKAQASNLQTQIKILRDGKVVLEGKPAPLNFDGQANSDNISISGALEFGKAFAAGEYTLQLNVIDNSAKEKDKFTTQTIQFVITE